MRVATRLGRPQRESSNVESWTRSPMEFPAVSRARGGIPRRVQLSGGASIVRRSGRRRSRVNSCSWNSYPSLRSIARYAMRHTSAEQSVQRVAWCPSAWCSCAINLRHTPTIRAFRSAARSRTSALVGGCSIRALSTCPAPVTEARPAPAIAATPLNRGRVAVLDPGPPVPETAIRPHAIQALPDFQQRRRRESDVRTLTFAFGARIYSPDLIRHPFIQPTARDTPSSRSSDS
jgi:hypothetical protein